MDWPDDRERLHHPPGRRGRPAGAEACLPGGVAVQRRGRPAVAGPPEYLVFTGEGVAEGRTVVALAGEEVVGFATVADGCELEDLFVDPRWQRRGIARRLVDRVSGLVRASGHRRMWVTGNPHALAFYLAAGFTPGERTSTALGTGLRMSLELPPDADGPGAG
ncbi:GNAT family N-acetyltransferase [Actinoplanes sp. NPDC020271]|uniref:GNAT family N-acetyltransferase n=1 Tax=Actinoplanes sp. NPDC020271 TaxID=3363896 RepID=UPI0037996ADD